MHAIIAWTVDTHVLPPTNTPAGVFTFISLGNTHATASMLYILGVPALTFTLSFCQCHVQES